MTQIFFKVGDEWVGRADHPNAGVGHMVAFESNDGDSHVFTLNKGEVRRPLSKVIDNFGIKIDSDIPEGVEPERDYAADELVYTWVYAEISLDRHEQIFDENWFVPLKHGKANWGAVTETMKKEVEYATKFTWYAGLAILNPGVPTLKTVVA